MKNTSCLVFRWLLNFELYFPKPTLNIPADMTAQPKACFPSWRQGWPIVNQRLLWGLSPLGSNPTPLSSHTELHCLPGLNSHAALPSPELLHRQAESELRVLKGTGNVLLLLLLQRIIPIFVCALLCSRKNVETAINNHYLIDFLAPTPLCSSL